MKESLSKLRLEDLTTSSPAMARCLQLAALAAKSDVPVVLLGETGTGKTLLAQAIHNSSARAGRPFVAFNASAISDTLLESQLFGHERGAFTGAQQSLKGKFELAHGGTIFLDEISEMSPLAQVKILRVLEYGEFERLGSERMLTTNARIICASNCSLRERVRLGKFREDLYHRLNGLTLLIPPLRERFEELAALIAAELKIAGLKEGKNITAIHPHAMDKLLHHNWPGNLRELKAVVTHAAARRSTGGIALTDLPEEYRVTGPSRTLSALDQAERDAIVVALREANGNKVQAATRLGVSRTTLYARIRQLRITTY